MDIFAGEESLAAKAARLPLPAQAFLYTALAALIMSLGVFYNGGQFIYFQF
jgi:hypothetical protein